MQKLHGNINAAPKFFLGKVGPSTLRLSLHIRSTHTLSQMQKFSQFDRSIYVHRPALALIHTHRKVIASPTMEPSSIRPAKLQPAG